MSRQTRVLVIDDNESHAEAVAEGLQRDGYETLKAMSGAEGAELLKTEPVHVVVTDLVMPGMSGRELVERIRQLAPGLRILCTSGYVMPADKQAGTGYLQKPFTSAELLAKVKQILSSKPPVD